LIAAMAAGLLAIVLWYAPWDGRFVGLGPAPVKITDFKVSHYRDKGKTLVGDLATSAALLRVNDEVKITAALSSPVYCYLLAFNPDGDVQLCLPDDASGHGAAKTAPEKRSAIRFPRQEYGFVLDRKGLQAFVLAASDKPLPPFSDWQREAGAIPWKAISHGGGERWQFDGRELTRLTLERGRIELREGAPEPFRELCAFFQGRSEFNAVWAIAFPVAEPRD
jgi:hypothetical protein